MKNIKEEFLGTHNNLAQHYSKFKVTERILLSGHSHQAWPDVAFEGIQECWEDASSLVDLKWSKVLNKIEDVKTGYRLLMNDDIGEMSFAQSTHELLVKLFSALDFTKKNKIILTDTEFYSVTRQINRLAETELINPVFVVANPVSDLPERMAEKIDSKTAICIISSIFFKSGLKVRDFSPLVEKCEKEGVPLLIDAYHSLNASEFDIKKLKLENAFITGGGYKYCQLGEGLGFLRFPPGVNLRPVITGWFSRFQELSNMQNSEKTQYGEGGLLFAGATFEPVSFYRASRVFRFFKENELNISEISELYKTMNLSIISEFLNKEINPQIIKIKDDVSIDERGGFVSFESNFAGLFYESLMKNNIYSDFRGNILRLGPAPYISESQIKEAIFTLAKIALTIKIN